MTVDGSAHKQRPRMALNNPLHPIIRMHILHTVLYIFSKVLTRRICLKARASLVGDHFFNSCNFNV